MKDMCGFLIVIALLLGTEEHIMAASLNRPNEIKTLLQYWASLPDSLKLPNQK